MREMPAIASSTYASHAVNLNALGAAEMGGIAQQNGAWLNTTGVWTDPSAQEETANAKVQALYHRAMQNQPQQETTSMANARRLVQVFIADPNDNVPLDQSLLYSGEQKFTDATDQELFFEIDINSILKAYNEKRVKIIDKKVKERTEYLEVAKIRDLKMVVVTVAGF